MEDRMKKKTMSVNLNKNKPLIVLFLIIAIMTVASPVFLTPGNLLTVLLQTSYNAILAVGISFTILIGGIDLSIGSVLAFSSAIGALLLTQGWPLFAVLLLILALGTLLGFLNGLLVSYGRLQAFIATLGTMSLWRGLTLVITQARPISIRKAPAADAFCFIGSGSVLGVPVPVWIMVLVFLLAYVILRHRRIGRYLYAIGCNEEAALYSGIQTQKVKLFAFSISGLLASLAGIIVTARLSSATPTAGTAYEMDAIAAAVLGGVSMAGGKGNIRGIAVGALIIGILSNALNLLNIGSYYQGVVKGIVILIAVLLDRGESQK
ncbi:MAG: ribose ABC transporter permease [Clostridiales bacterium]|nr:ribose ABC transporter permease [Clostridiales bacterium]MDD7432127.1 ribose ABC transporter permease [Clostridiales bacterium]MDY3061112.1 ribose ABC transporter permease [Eubacteriales bacterium]